MNPLLRAAAMMVENFLSTHFECFFNNFLLASATSIAILHVK
jgi:hypothetical protein